MERRDVEALLALRSEIEAVRASGEPVARVLVPRGPVPQAVRSLAVMPGAYNPPTTAHLALARAAAARGFDRVLLSLGCVTVDKDESGLVLEDRLRLLSSLAEGDPRLGVVLQNRALYVEMAEALRRALPAAEDLAFVCGMDKVAQLFDARYYDDMPGSLATLFAHARFVVAPRGDGGRAELERLLATPEARPFAGRFGWLDLDPRWRDLSATRVREGLERGEHVDEWLPPDVAAFVRATGVFREPDRYAARIARRRAARLGR